MLLVLLSIYEVKNKRWKMSVRVKKPVGEKHTTGAG
jgi:hypothetical protein